MPMRDFCSECFDVKTLIGLGSARFDINMPKSFGDLGKGLLKSFRQFKGKAEFRIVQSMSALVILSSHERLSLLQRLTTGPKKSRRGQRWQKKPDANANQRGPQNSFPTVAANAEERSDSGGDPD